MRCPYDNKRSLPYLPSYTAGIITKWKRLHSLSLHELWLVPINWFSNSSVTRTVSDDAKSRESQLLDTKC